MTITSFSASFFQPISDFKNYSYKELLSIPSAVEWKQLFTDSLSTVLNLKVNDEFWNDSLISPAGYPVKPMIILKNQQAPNSLKLSLQPSSEQVLMNVIGVLPGKSKAGEVILFSAHYDHVPPGKSRRGVAARTGGCAKSPRPRSVPHRWSQCRK